MRHPWRLLARLSILALSVLADAGPARCAAPADTASVEIEGLTVFGTRPLTTRGGSSAIRAVLDSLPIPAAGSLEQVLRSLPAIHVRTNSRGEAEISVRGSESRQVAVLVDGVPLTLSWDGRTDVSVIPMGALRQVTLVRGLSTLLAGPNVLGGAIEFESGVAGGRPGPVSFQVRSGADQVGAFGVSAAVTAPRALPGGVISMRAGIGHRDSPGVPLAKGVVEPIPADDLRINTDLTETDGFASVRLDRGDGGWVSLAGSAFRAERGIAAELGVSAPRFWRYPYIARSLTVLSGGSGVQRAPWGGESSLRASFGLDVGRTEIDAFDSRTYEQLLSEEDGDQRTLSMRIMGTQTFGRRVDLRLGVTSGDLTYDEHLQPGGTSRYRHRLWSVAGESVVRLPFANGGVLDEIDLSLGGAFDRSTNPLAGGKTALGPRNEWGGRAGVSALLADGAVTVHASASRRARFPSLRELYSGALGRFDPNPGLEPEKLVATEAGVTLRSPSGTLQLVGYHQRLSDAVVRILTRPKGPYRRVNQEGLQSAGVELLGSRIVGRFTLDGSLVAQSVELLDPNAALEHPENLPEVSGGLRVEVSLPHHLALGAGTHFIGDQFAINPDSGDLATLPARARVDADLGHTWCFGSDSDRISMLHARIAAENLTDEAIYDAIGLSEPGRTIRLELRLQ
jgi:iron complex outermembrane receptor protein